MAVIKEHRYYNLSSLTEEQIQYHLGNNQDDHFLKKCSE